MDIRESSSSSVTLQRVALKNLNPEMDNILVVAIIIGKQRPRIFNDSVNENGQTRAVWNFTLRDSPRDYINVTYWGTSDDVCLASDKFYTGDVVELRNPKIYIRKFNDTGEMYRPVVTSPYSLTLNENSQILPYSGDTFSLSKLINIPTKPLAGFVSLRDIQNDGANLKDRFVDILGAVKNVGQLRQIKTKGGQEAQLREVVLFDHTNPGLKITIWDTDIMTRAATWKPRTTILFVTDVKVDWSSFLRTYSASLTNRSIVTENPVGQEAATLAKFAETAPLSTSDILYQRVTSLPDPDTIQNVMCVQQIHNKVVNLLEENGGDTQITALLFAFVSQLDLDGLSRTTKISCAHCKRWIKDAACQNAECPVVLGTSAPDLDISFDIRVNLTDHTGTLTDCRLFGAVAEQVLGCTVTEFMKMSNEEKRQLKWKFLMERCAVRILVMLLMRRKPTISIVTFEKADPIDSAQRIPIY